VFYFGGRKSPVSESSLAASGGRMLVWLRRSALLVLSDSEEDLEISPLNLWGFVDFTPL
jgi:hypothetical protein